MKSGNAILLIRGFLKLMNLFGVTDAESRCDFWKVAQ